MTQDTVTKIKWHKTLLSKGKAKQNKKKVKNRKSLKSYSRDRMAIANRYISLHNFITNQTEEYLQDREESYKKEENQRWWNIESWWSTIKIAIKAPRK